MLAERKLKRRIDDVLGAASSLALADAMDLHICSRSTQDLRELIVRSMQRMDNSERAQLQLYANLDHVDDLLGHRFSAFLLQNPRAIAALDPDAIDAILAELGEVKITDRPVRRLPARTVAMIGLVVAVAVLSLAGQYVHQRGLIEGLSEPIALPPPIVPFVQTVALRPASAAQLHRVGHRARAKAPAHRSVAQRHRGVRAYHRVAARPGVHIARPVAWKFDPHNNPYFNRVRWHHPYVADVSPFAQRARLSVRSYLHAIVAGNLGAALVHLGMPPTGDTNALGELPIITRRTMVAIVGSKPQAGGSEEVQADIVTDGREYYEVFSVAPDGPATRIVYHYYIPVNRRAQVASRITRTE